MKNLLHPFGKNSLDEVIFENRNKAYGAYVLRSEYSSSLTKSLFIGIAFAASLAIVPMLVNYFTNKNTDIIYPCPQVFDLTPIDDPLPQPNVSVPQNIKTVKSPEYVPTRFVKNDQPAPDKKDFENAAIGIETNPGTETTLSVAPPISVVPPANIPYKEPLTQPAEDENKIVDKADLAANFKGGIDAFRKKVSQNFDTSAVAEAGMVSATVTFVVEKDGSISNIRVVGENPDFNKEAERTIKSIKTKWTPAQLSGKAVRFSFRMPISMRIE